MNLVRSRSWGQVKPHPGARIDWGHSLAQGLVFVALVNEHGGAPFDLVTGQRSVITNGITGYDRKLFSGIELSKASSQSLSWTGYTGPLARASVNNQLSVLIIGWDNAPGSAAHDPWFTTIGANVGYRLSSFGQTEGVILDNITSGATVGSGVDNPTGREIFAVMTYDPSEIHLYQDTVGWLNAKTGTTNSCSVLTPGGAPKIGPINGGTCLVYVWHRRLQPTDIAAVRAEPYAFIAPPGPKVLYFDLFIPPTGTARALEAKSATASKLSLSRVAV